MEKTERTALAEGLRALLDEGLPLVSNLSNAAAYLYAALDGVNYATATTNGSAEADPSGVYQYIKGFATEQEAVSWCNTKLNIQQS